jgi:hypothetical protein
VLSITPGAFVRADGPARTGRFGVALRCSVLMSYVRVSTLGWIRTSVLRPRKAVLGSAELRAYAVKQSLRQESNPHLIRTKGVCLPLTLRRHELHGDGGNRTHLLLGASERHSPERVPTVRSSGADGPPLDLDGSRL